MNTSPGVGFCSVNVFINFAHAAQGPVTRGNFLCNLECNADDNATLQAAGRCQTFATLFATRNATNSLSARLLEALQDFFFHKHRVFIKLNFHGLS